MGVPDVRDAGRSGYVTVEQAFRHTTGNPISRLERPENKAKNSPPAASEVIILFSRRRSQVRVDAQPKTTGHSDPAKFAWQVHLAQEAWMSKVDTKGSILLALEGGALFAILSASGKDGVPGRINGWHHPLEISGTMMILLAMASAGLAVFPRLGISRKHRGQYRDEFLYFGHLRHWAPEELDARMRRLHPEDELTALTSQVVRISKSTWTKYRLVQLSLVLAISGIGAVSIAVLPF